MKKILKTVLIMLFQLIPFKASAPVSLKVTIAASDRVEPFRRLIHAIGMVETEHDTLAYNRVEDAIGYFQIRPIRLLDYNLRTGSNFSKNDLFDYFISEKIFLYYAIPKGPYKFEQIARSWNGSGDSTLEYWKKVKAYL
jgi:hypothetical protein